MRQNDCLVFRGQKIGSGRHQYQKIVQLPDLNLAAKPSAIQSKRFDTDLSQFGHITDAHVVWLSWECGKDAREESE
ncbi:MAG TPA: hypothetical protein DCX75_00850 [Brevundimonas sp.]|nr:hypothetical protein [Brevundimonas sp.]HAV48843.1 hypothetical protein [Brevundimonas sp.]